MTSTPITKNYFQMSNGWPVLLICNLMKYGAMQRISGPNWPPKAHLVDLAIELGMTEEEVEEWRLANKTKKPIERFQILKEAGVGGEGGSNDAGDEDAGDEDAGDEDAGDEDGVNEGNEAMQSGEEDTMDQTEDFGEYGGDPADKSAEQTGTEPESQGTYNDTSISFAPIAQHLHGSAQPQPQLLTDNGPAFQRWTIEQRHDHLLTAIGGDVLPIDYQTPSAPNPGNSSSSTNNARIQPQAVPSSSGDPNLLRSSSAANQDPEFDYFGYTEPDPDTLPSLANSSRDQWQPFADRQDAGSDDPFGLDPFGVFKRNEGRRRDGDGGDYDR